jgi:hypothetical protein
MEQAVKNAADPKQVKRSKKQAALADQQKRLDLESILKLPQGRRVMWRLLAKAGMFRSVWESNAKIHYNAGRQDYGFWLWAEIEKSNPDYMLLMMKENRKETEDV